MASKRAKHIGVPATPTLRSLPYELLSCIAVLLSLKERLTLSRVCKQLHAFVGEAGALWHNIDFGRANFLTAETSLTHSVQRVAFVQERINAVRSINIGPSQRTPLQGRVPLALAPLLAVLSGATALRKLCILADISPETYLHCGLLHQLTSLEVGPVTDCLDAEQLSSCLWGLTQLRSLRLRFELEQGDRAPLEGPYSLPPALLRLTALTHLSFGRQRPHDYDLSPPGVEFVYGELPAELFQQLRHLQYLQLFNCTVTGVPANISLLTGLQTLSILSSTELETPQLQLPPEISSCTALTSLQLSCAAVPQHMWCLPLRELTLDQTTLTVADMQQFTRLSALQSLRLCNRKISGEVFGEDPGQLAVSTSLTCLRLDGNNMGGIPFIPALGQLLVLDLKRNSLSGVADVELQALRALRVLDLSFDDGLSLADDGREDDEDASAIASAPALRVLGLRKDCRMPWDTADLQAVSDIHRIRQQMGRPPIRMVIKPTNQLGGPPEAFCGLDRDTYFLDTVVNDCRY